MTTNATRRSLPVPRKSLEQDSKAEEAGKRAATVSSLGADALSASYPIASDHTLPPANMQLMRDAINVFNEVRNQLQKQLPEGIEFSKPNMREIVAPSVIEIATNIDRWMDENKEAVEYLKQLNLENLGLKSLPSFLGKFINLETLKLKNNEIKKLPDWIGDLQELEGLDLSDNNISVLPNSISKLKKLNVINLSGNKFEKAPDILEEMRKDNTQRRYKSLSCVMYKGQIEIGQKKSPERCLNIAKYTLASLGVILASALTYSFFAQE
ncbi:MAG: hypothetical protein KR126chlam4_00541 [Candidatus Anoxychlamydiales bacterium]|uniref:Disease resistance R13L4/SHOC-2-like LRR domain-containing protein n=1 Tax=marine sediment metagenome TaxID=412755 RepID=A0A0F9MH71_9ZZZZ|nr:hypothetical protein [Candidatus Anoxychlamydiales bacterium]